MTFCKFSSSYQTKNQTLIDNVFITDFLPKAPDLCVKAYLLGLHKCNTADDVDNNLEYFAKTLNVSEEDVVSLFRYWEDMGLVQVLSTNPIEVRFLPINSTSVGVKKFKVDKYANFNIQAQELIGERMIMPNDYADFYNLMQNCHIEENAMLAIIKYCVEKENCSAKEMQTADSPPKELNKAIICGSAVIFIFKLRYMPIKHPAKMIKKSNNLCGISAIIIVEAIIIIMPISMTIWNMIIIFIKTSNSCTNLSQTFDAIATAFIYWRIVKSKTNVCVIFSRR